VLVCAHGESSSLAAASLVELGLHDAGDLDGGFEAWRQADLPVAAAPEPQGTPGMGGPQ
jgi:rhodanese-related sulfurtransferase